MNKADLLRAALLENLTTGQWRAGQKLPTERQLSDEYGVSRTTVRRVLANLKEKRLIRQTVGSGTYASEEVSYLLDGHIPLHSISPAELMAARLVLELSIVELVVHNATSADFARMEECCDRGESASSFEEFEYWDSLLHKAIAAAAHNHFIDAVFRLIDAARSQAQWGALKRKSLTQQRLVEYQREHRSIVAALRDRDMAAACDAARGHLLHVRSNLLGQMPEAGVRQTTETV